MNLDPIAARIAFVYARATIIGGLIATYWVWALYGNDRAMDTASAAVVATLLTAVLGYLAARDGIHAARENTHRDQTTRSHPE